jgi:hypothetical protein
MTHTRACPTIPTKSEQERVEVKSFREGGEYLYRLVKRLSGGK